MSKTVWDAYLRAAATTLPRLRDLGITTQINETLHIKTKLGCECVEWSLCDADEEIIGGWVTFEDLINFGETHQWPASANIIQHVLPLYVQKHIELLHIPTLTQQSEKEDRNDDQV